MRRRGPGGWRCRCRCRCNARRSRDQTRGKQSVENASGVADDGRGHFNVQVVHPEGFLFDVVGSDHFLRGMISGSASGSPTLR